MPLKQKLKDFLDEHHIKYIMMVHSRAYTAQELAATLHVPGKLFAKTVILKSNGNYLMAVLPATHKVNFDRFKKLANIKKIALASEEEFMNLFPKCELGAMPPFGNLYELPTFVDVTLAEEEDIYFNATTHSEVIKMKFKDYQKLVEPVIGSFADHM